MGEENCVGVPTTTGNSGLLQAIKKPTPTTVIVEKISNGWLVFPQHYLTAQKVYVSNPYQLSEEIEKILSPKETVE